MCLERWNTWPISAICMNMTINFLLYMVSSSPVIYFQHWTLIFLYVLFRYDDIFNLHNLVIAVTREKKVDVQKRQTSRSLFQCHVIGPKGVGKVSQT